jgi:PAS domain S-box-containing protein
MFSLGLFPSAFPFLYLGAIFPQIILPEDFLAFLGYQWGVFPVMISISFILVDRLFYRKKDFTVPFMLFLFFYFLSFFIILFNIFDLTIYSISRQFAAVLIIGMSIVLIFKERKISNWLFLLSMGCFAIGGIAQNVFMQEPEYFSNAVLVFFGYLLGFIFLVLIFGETKIVNQRDGVEVYFSLQNRLKKVESALYDTEQRYRQLVEHINEGIWVLNDHFQTTYVNSFLAHMLGYTTDEMIGKSLFDFMDNNSRKIAKEKLAHMGALSNVSYEFDFLRKDNISVSTTIRLSTLFEPKGTNFGMIAAVQDISARKRMEHDLSVKLDKLQKSELATINIMEDLQSTIHALTVAEMEIRDKNNELQKINRELLAAREQLTFLNKNLEIKVQERTAEVENLLKQKDEFINQLGHDLKTPLTPLNILMPLIQEREKDPHVKELLDVVSNNIQYMKNLVIKTLALAQLNSLNFKFGFEDVNLSQHVQKILGMDLPLFEGKHVNIENNIPQDIIVHADFLQVKELFDNLFSNAIKYSHESGVTITLDAQKKDDTIIVSVKDNGIGLESDKLPHVFDEFYKVDSSRHDLQSTGLGLSICKRIVEKHGGRIWVESPGKGLGSTFFFTLPPSKN